MWNPRVGGEKARCSVTGAKFWGSPPRGRGKGHRPGIESGPLRITPAWAGKSVVCDSATFSFKDHPRMGGEKMPEV